MIQKPHAQPVFEVTRDDLRHLVDVVWQHALEDQQVPGTDTADALIDNALSNINMIITRTPAEVYQLWIAALRSNKYKQGKGRLRDGDAFCSLGVLCDLAVKDGGPKWVSSSSLGSTIWFFRYMCAEPPPVMCRFMKFSGKEIGELVQMNDRQNHTFAQISDHIEQTLLPRVINDRTSII